MNRLWITTGCALAQAVMFFRMREGDLRAVDQLEILFRARIEFRPHFAVVRVHDFQPALDVGPLIYRRW